MNWFERMALNHEMNPPRYYYNWLNCSPVYREELHCVLLSLELSDLIDGEPRSFNMIWNIMQMYDPVQFRSMFQRDLVQKLSMLKFVVDVSEERYNRAFICPGHQNACWIPHVPVGQNIWTLNTMHFTSSYSNSRTILRGDVTGKHQSYIQPSLVQLWLFNEYLLEELNKTGSAWVQLRGTTVDGVARVFRLHVQVHATQGLCICRFQDVTTIYPHMLAMPPDCL